MTRAPLSKPAHAKQPIRKPSETAEAFAARREKHLRKAAAQQRRLTARQDPNLRRTIWPRRREPGLAREMFYQALADAQRDLMAPPAQPAKPDGLIGVIEAALRLCAAVGLPELWSRPTDPEARIETKAPTLLELDQGRGGLVIRLIHRVAHSRHRLEEAAEALSDIMAAIGREVRVREINHAPKLGGWQAVLRIAPVMGRPAPAMVR